MTKSAEKEVEDQSTEEKAEDIGKKVESIKTEEEAVPDYEITEEGSKTEAADDDKKDDEQEDKRIGKERDGSERTERVQLTNREKRILKKKRLSEKFDAKDTLIRQQQEQLNAMASRLNDVDGRLSNFDQAQLQQAYAESVNAYKLAEADHQTAFSTGDGVKATKAMRDMYIAQRRIDDLEALNARKGSVIQRQQQQPQQADPTVVSRATSWAERNAWFKPGGGDDDSAIADTIAAKLVKEGYDPKSDDYWDELDERLEKKGVGERQQDDEDDVDPPPRKEAKRRGPPVGGGNGRGDIGSGKVSVSLPTAYINALKESGKWDDPATRNRMIKRYLDGVKNNAGAS